MSDVYYAVIRVPIPSANGNFDVTSVALNGLTPKAAIFFGGSYPSSLVGSPLTAADYFQHVIGFAANGGNTYSVATGSDDNTGNTDNDRRQDAAPVRWINPAAQTLAVNSWITNGIRLTLGVSDTTLREMWCLLIAGDDVEAAVNRINLGTGTAALAQAIGFNPDLVFTINAQRDTDSNASATTAAIGYGVGYKTAASPLAVSYRWTGWGEAFNVASGGQPATHVRNDCCAAGFNVTNGAVSYQLTLQNFSATGFDIKPSASGESHRLAYLALYLGGKKAHLFDFNVPTTTQDVSYTGLGFDLKPAAVLLCGSAALAINTGYFNDTSSVGFSLGGFDANTEYAHSASCDPTADPTNTKQVTTDVALLCPSSTNPAATIASRVSIDNDGFTLSYSVVSGTATLAWGVALEGNTVPQTGDIRVTQAPLMVGIRGDGVQRVTQSAVLVGIKTERPPCLTQEADCWKITRTDGVVKRFTSHDRRITYAGEVYSPCGSASASALQVTAAAEGTDNMDLNGLLSTTGVSAADIWNGKYEGATVEVYRIAWGGTSYSYLVKAGIVGAVQFGDTEYRLEVLTANDRLAQTPVLSVVSPGCRWKFGSTQCGVNVAALAVTGAVTSVPAVNVFTGAHRRVFTDTSRTEPDGRFTLGRITWTGGANNGFSCDVKSYAADVFTLAQILPYPIAVGDTYSVTPGCDKLAATCHDTYANKINFGGFEFVRGTDDLAKTPEQDV